MILNILYNMMLYNMMLSLHNIDPQTITAYSSSHPRHCGFEHHAHSTREAPRGLTPGTPHVKTHDFPSAEGFSGELKLVQSWGQTLLAREQGANYASHCILMVEKECSGDCLSRSLNYPYQFGWQTRCLFEIFLSSMAVTRRRHIDRHLPRSPETFDARQVHLVLDVVLILGALTENEVTKQSWWCTMVGWYHYWVVTSSKHHKEMRPTHHADAAQEIHWLTDFDASPVHGIPNGCCPKQWGDAVANLATIAPKRWNQQPQAAYQAGTRSQ